MKTVKLLPAFPLLFILLLSACRQTATAQLLMQDAQDTLPAASAAMAETNQGSLASEVIWSGEVLVDKYIVIPQGATLRVEPGTVVRFKPCRGYQESCERVGLEVVGTIIAEGTTEQPIYFTSADPDPQNGDWHMLRVIDSDDSFFNYVVVEFAQQGLNFWGGSPKVHNSVVRWNNWEGIYIESYAEAEIYNTHIYQNGYNGIAAEQFNNLVIENCLIEKNGTHGVHIDASNAIVLTSHVLGNNAAGLSVDNSGSLVVEGVRASENMAGVEVGEGDNILRIGRAQIEGNITCQICGEYEKISGKADVPTQIDFHFTPEMSNALGYIPGDREKDQYPYIFDDTDETREVVSRIGEGLGLTWAVAWDGEAVWTASLWAEYYRLDPQTGAILQQFTGPGSQVWGLTFDGQHLWTLDFAEKMIYEIDPENGQTLSQFPSPDPDNGCKGITWDGQYLYVNGWALEVIYIMDRQGNTIGTISRDGWGGGGLAWDGSYFWAPGGNEIIKATRDGEVAGWIYAASEGTWDMAWGNGLLWVSQRTNENWNDAKIYGIRVLDDHDE